MTTPTTDPNTMQRVDGTWAPLPEWTDDEVRVALAHVDAREAEATDLADMLGTVRRHQALRDELRRRGRKF